MIKANELRIWNLVFEGFDIYEVTSITRSGQLRLFSAKENHSSGTSKIKPIPITKEWLLKFGFSKYDQMGDNYFFAFEKDDNFEFNLFLNFNKLKVSFYGLNWERAFKIDSVHQLQNLYFALTGQELHP
jgi:hypothetical protein